MKPKRSGVARAPGRVNLIGEHTDYQEGFCLPVAIDREVQVEWTARKDDVITVQSRAFDEIATLDPIATSSQDFPAWAAIPAAMVSVLSDHGCNRVGIDVAVESSIPIGAGLSSSAAVSIAFGMAIASAADFALGPADLARAARSAEVLATGVPCGLMDQFASVHGRAGHALFLDCRTHTVTPIAIPPDLAILVAHCGVPRLLADTEYAQRRAEVEVAATRLGVRTLRDASPEDVHNDRFARHVVSENRRTLMFVAALRRGRFKELGTHMLDSHASLRDDFRVSTPSLDSLVESFMFAGAIGARLTGAGFGGCVVAICDANDAPRVMDLTIARYLALTGLETEPFVANACGGASLLVSPN